MASLQVYLLTSYLSRVLKDPNLIRVMTTFHGDARLLLWNPSLNRSEPLLQIKTNEKCI